MADEKQLINTNIDGVTIQPLKIIDTAGGAVLHMLRPDYPLMPDFSKGFGEIYFSEVLPGAVKAWKLHKKQTQHFAVPVGLLKIVLYDGRKSSPTMGEIAELKIGRPDNYCLLRIPPNIWYGFTALNKEKALICNCADLPHDPEEAERQPADSMEIPYAWRRIS